MFGHWYQQGTELFSLLGPQPEGSLRNSNLEPGSADWAKHYLPFFLILTAAAIGTTIVVYKVAT